MKFLNFGILLVVLIPPNTCLKTGIGGSKSASSTSTSGAGVCPNVPPITFFQSASTQEALTTGSLTVFTSNTLLQGLTDSCLDFALQKYRTFDGKCNHPKNYGAAVRPLTRLLHHAYDDGIDSPRQTTTDGSPLPSARLVSRYVHPAMSKPLELTPLSMQWGQFLDHDITLTPVVSGKSGNAKCCSEKGGPKDCFPIQLPADEDNFIGKCMEFVRSVPATDCNGYELKPREQLNVITSFIDGSQIYGSSEELANSLREEGLSSHLLRTKNGNFLPESDAEDCIKRPGSNDYCFKAGDIRVNEQAGLAGMHTVWLRNHNIIAQTLKELDPFASPDEIFLKTRKIIGALLQHITYNEWLGIVMGDAAASLKLESKTGRSPYIPSLDPRILNPFATAAFRFGHSMIPGAYAIGNRKVPLRQLFNRPEEVLDNFDDLIAGLAGVGTLEAKAESVDRNFDGEVTNHLFEPLKGRPGRGMDLVALNIQRGRDHGLPSYTEFRDYCGLPPLTGFDDTEALGPFASQLANVYRSVDDIDLFTGLVHEPPESGLIGPTLRCILGLQFFNLKYGDRFFFDTVNTYVGFTDSQLQNLRNMTLSKILCAATNIDSFPLSAFKVQSADNPLVPCTELRKYSLDLSLFKDSLMTMS